MSAQHRDRKSAALYWWIVAVTITLDALMVWSCIPVLTRAWHSAPITGVLAGLCLAFISYFWLNGVKDLAYTICYYVVMHGRPRNPPLWQAHGSPRVVMVYCTCDDFNAASLEMSMNQDYANYEVVILDDSKSPEFREEIDAWAAGFGIEVIRRRNGRGAKAGNLNHGLALLTWDYFVILDSDEVVPNNFISRALDYFTDDPRVGVVQGSHRASRPRNRFMERFSLGVDSFWSVIQPVRDRYGFMSLLGHGAMVSRKCFTQTGGMPEEVAEDVAFSIRARSCGWLTVFASDLMCEEEYPVNYLAFRKRHNKWTQGQVEFIKRHTSTIANAQMRWFEKLDVTLFAYSMPLTALLVIFVAINAVAMPLLGFHLIYPIWMLIPTTLFIFAPALNDVIYHWRRPVKKRELATYVLQSMLLFGSLFVTSVRAASKSVVGGSTFLITPKVDTRLTLREAVRANRWELGTGAALSGIVIWLTGSILGIGLITVPAIFSVFMSVMHQSHRRPESLFVEPSVHLDELIES